MTTISHVPGYRASRAAAYTERSPRSRSIGLEVVGLVTLVASAWGGIIPFVGPTFGFNATGAPSWHWDLSQAVLGLVPGAIGVLVGLSLMAPSVSTVGWRRLGMTTMGLLGIAAGAWFVIGPFAWPVITTSGSYFVAGATPLSDLAHLIGYALGPGLILAMAGGYMLGWATRHDAPLSAYGSSGDTSYGGASGQMAGGTGPAWASNPASSPPTAAPSPAQAPPAPTVRPTTPPPAPPTAPPVTDHEMRSAAPPAGADPTGYEAGYEATGATYEPRTTPEEPPAPRSPAA